MSKAKKRLKELAEKKITMKTCNHLFVKTEELHKWGDENTPWEDRITPPTVVCVKCGLTNSRINKKLEPKEFDIDGSRLQTNTFECIAEIFNEDEFRSQYPRPILELIDRGILNLMSDEVVGIKNPETLMWLYRMALANNPNGTNKQLLESMKTIYEIAMAKKETELSQQKDKKSKKRKKKGQKN